MMTPMMTPIMSNHTQGMQALRATMTRTLPQLGSGVNMFDAPAEAVGNSKLKISLASSMVDIRV